MMRSMCVFICCCILLTVIYCWDRTGHSDFKISHHGSYVDVTLDFRPPKSRIPYTIHKTMRIDILDNGKYVVFKEGKNMKFDVLDNAIKYACDEMLLVAEATERATNEALQKLGTYN